MNSGRHWNNESTLKTVTFQEYVEARWSWICGGLRWNAHSIPSDLWVLRCGQPSGALPLIVSSSQRRWWRPETSHWESSKLFVQLPWFQNVGDDQLPLLGFSRSQISSWQQELWLFDHTPPKTTVVLRLWDFLYNPPWSWHRVTNKADKETKLVVMSSCRWSDVGTALCLSSGLELYKSLGWGAFLHPSAPLWLQWVPFFRVVQDGFREYFSLMPSFGDASYNEDCFSSKAEGCNKVPSRTGHGII